ncbi:MAG: MBL fold metallo-hydrolase, partial [Planctomycetota bacterium]
MELEIRTLPVGPFQQNARVVVESTGCEALVIDPGDEAERILRTVEAMGGKVRYVLLTHAHLDHAGAAAPVRRALGAPLALHRADFALLGGLSEQGRMFGISGIEVPDVDIDLTDVETLSFGDGEIRVVPTPGHTPGGVTFLIGAQGFFGDTLFQGSVGRTDLGGDAQVYARTLREVVLALPDETVVMSGHGPDTTIGIERRTNPFLNGTLALDGS